MNIRWNTLWRVPVFCVIASWVSFMIMVYMGGFFYADPVRSAIFDGAVFLIILLIGGLLCFRSMTRAEIAVSAGIISSIYLAVALAQLYVPGFPVSLSVTLARFRNWTSIVAAALANLINSPLISITAASFVPFLFVPFGRKQTNQ
ncbi:hypothetical protein D1159_06655 [Pseudoflavonifractor sp. 524-17]|uniref:hypothetical protein n=1 Tax=Pseudoflavonifractor sp. 524-17 TaxID=2304577 RepID=UPI00137B5C2E|nr:hypothetical protein [Pseudoflavonifractor sp. 524-17]NCE64273.1 hypothetical protein [Pseudoflavonifractor sp. 524-17]